MSKPLFQMTDRDLLKSIAAFHGGFQPPHIVLEGLTEDQATAKPHGLPHSIAEIVAHMLYWQEFFNRNAEAGWSGVPEHAAEGWPATPPGGWEALREEFLASCNRMQTLAAQNPRLDSRLLPEGIELPFLNRESIGSGLLHAAVHSSHHLGQIVTIRQLLGAWPPPSGSMTW